MSIDLELHTVDLDKGTSTEVSAVDGATGIDLVPSKFGVEGHKKEYSIIGDGLYAQVSAESAPQWLLSIIDEVLAVNLANGLTSLDDAVAAINTALGELDIAKNQYQELINIEATIDSIITSRLTTLNATVGTNSASIVTLDSTKVTADQALAIAADHLSSELLDGDVSAALTTLESTLTTPITANADSISVLSTSINDPSIGLTATASAMDHMQSYVGIDEAGASTGVGLSAYLEDGFGHVGGATSEVANTVYTDGGVVKSKWEYDSTLYKDGVYYNAGFGLNLEGGTGAGTALNPYSSEFWINAEKFKFTNSAQSGQVAPFTIDGSGAVPKVTFNGLVTFGNSQSGTVDEAITASIETKGVATEAFAEAQVATVTDNIYYPGTTEINGGAIRTGTVSANTLHGGVLYLDGLAPFTPSPGFSGSVGDSNGIRVYNNGIARVRIGKL